jgi:outer membrane protein OmpA-like peptidoglycan-associated protein
MPLTEDDAIRVLTDPILQRMDFWVDNIHVRGEAYAKIAEFITDEQILVVSGTNPLRGEYNPSTDTITTKNVAANLFGNCHIVHESTHAIADMERAVVTWKTNEAAARIAQATYLLLSDPGLWDSSLGKPGQRLAPEYQGFLSGAMALVKQFQLDSDPGAGTRLTMYDVEPMLKAMQSEPSYHQDHASLSRNDGISAKAQRFLHLKDTSGPSHDSTVHMVGYKVTNNALFGFRMFDISAEAESTLQQAGGDIAKFKQPDQRVYITGYADSIGDPTQNKRLSKQRADAVAQWLISRKFVKPGDVITAGEGAAKPVAPNTLPNGRDNPEGRAQNRRVEILIL